MKKKIINHLIKKGYRAEELKEGILVTISIEDKEIKILGVFKEKFPFELPLMYLLNRNSFGFLAHVSWNIDNKGLICTGISKNRNIDYDNPNIVYEKCLLDCIKTIEKSLKNKDYNKNEIIEEFNAYWNEIIAPNNIAFNFIEPSNNLREIKVFETSSQKIYFLEENSEINLDCEYIKKIQSKHKITGKGIYIPFPVGFLPPTPLENIKNWLNNTLTKHLDLLQKLFKLTHRKPLKTLWIISSIKLYNKYLWFVLKFESKDKIQIKNIEELLSLKITPYGVETYNKSYILPRGGAINSESKKILLVGCGSVGGEIANNIVSTGIVRDLTLIDFDYLKFENTYRHTLGGKYVGYQKTIALKEELISKYPYLNIKYQNTSITKFLQEDFINSFDGIIMATGDATIERYFNNEIFKMKKRPWLVYTWVEAYGIGGHAIYIHNRGKGCLNCLYKNIYGEKSLHSIQNFIEVNQNTTVDISGCGSHFVPYSFLDAKETALLASKLILKALLNELKESKRISWKGNFFKNSNIKTTYRYSEPSENCLKLTCLYWDKCDVCND